MKNAMILILIAVAVCYGDTTFVSGAVSGVWDTSGSPYIIEDSTWFEDTLIIEPGVEVILHSSILLCDSSYIRVLGTEDSIYFYGNENSLYIANLYYTHTWNVVFEKCVFTGFDNIQVPAWFNECRFIDSDFGDRRCYRGYHPTTKCVFENCDITGYAEIFENCLITGDSITLFAPESMGEGGLFLYSCTIYGNGLISGDFSGSPRDINYVYAMNCLIVGNPSFTYSYAHMNNSDTINTSDIDFINRVFLDYPHGDFHLADSSLAIGAGDTTFLRYCFYLEDDTLVIEDDFDGNPRPNPLGSMPDLGCYENPRAIADAIGEVASPLKPDEISIFAYPNPFNSAVSISLDYRSEPCRRRVEQVGCGPAAGGVGASDARSGQVGIEIFDISGHLVADLPVTNCGEPQFVPTPRIWRPDKSLGSGVYLIRARFGDCEITKRVVYLK